MRQLLKDGSLIETSEKLNKKVHDDIFVEAKKEYHYLSFDKQFQGYSPLNLFTAHAPELQSNEKDIFKSLMEKKEVCTLFPKLNLTLYPIQIGTDGLEYYLDLVNIDKHFKDILEINDQVYKTKKMFIDFGHGAANLDKDLILSKVADLLNKSSILEEVYLD